MKFPLIEITTVPVEIEMKVTDAHLEYHRGTAQMEVRRDQGGLQIKSKPIRVQLDTFEARNSITPTTIESIKRTAETSRQHVYNVVATMAREGNMMMEAQMDEDIIPEIIRQKTMPQLSHLGVEFLPSAPLEIRFTGGEMNIRYEMDKLNFDWRMQQTKFTFIPGDIEFSTTQNPDVIIKYVGDPLYVPPSSNPNYEPVNVMA